MHNGSLWNGPEENKYGGIQRWAVEGYLEKIPSKRWYLS